MTLQCILFKCNNVILKVARSIGIHVGLKMIFQSSSSSIFLFNANVRILGYFYGKNNS